SESAPSSSNYCWCFPIAAIIAQRRRAQTRPRYNHSAPPFSHTDMRPTWAEISLTALRHNFRTILDHVAPSATVCAVVKADAYGHGAADCAKALEAEGATWFGVTGPDEGIRLRQAGITSRILLLNGFWRGEEEAVVEHDLTPAVWEP